MAISSKRGDGSDWDSFWHGLTPESEIQMWDFYGGRPWVLKHTPRYGKVLEAGCGVGRYVFYLSLLGIDIEGLDFHEPTVAAVRRWAAKRGLQSIFRVGNVTQLPYDNECLSGYLSFGVIEHFEEGPAKALAEAHRVLRPGGVAVISTPSVSFAQAYFRFRQRVKETVKRIIGRPIVSKPFFQYWYTPRQLRSFVEKCGLRVVLYGAGDLKYAFWELTPQPVPKFGFRLADFLEQTPLARWGAQAFSISVKVGREMYCFLCGEKSVPLSEWKEHYLPICNRCSNSPLAKYYKKRVTPHFHARWQYDPSYVSESNPIRYCHFCEKPARPDILFEDFGFCVPVCRECLRIPERNIIASNETLQPRWRPRKPTYDPLSIPENQSEHKS